MNEYPARWDDPKAPEVVRHRELVSYRDAGSRMIRDALTGPNPSIVVSLGDAECKWLFLEHLLTVPGIDKEWLRSSSKASGLDPDGDAGLRPASLLSLKASPILLLQHNWPCAERMAVEALTAAGLYFGCGQMSKPMVSANCVYRLHSDGCLAPVLAGRRVLLVGGCQAPGWVTRMMDKGWQGRNGLDFEVVGHVQVPARGVRPKSVHGADAARAMACFDYDIALLAAGGFAFALAGVALRDGKSAFDCGAMDRQVMGETRRGTGGFVQ